MRWDAVLDLVQAIALIVVASVLSLTFWMLRREFLKTGQALRDVLQSQQALLEDHQSILENVDRVWKRVEENTARMDALKQEIDKLKAGR